MKMAKKIIRHFHKDSLYRNSIYLMLSTFIMAFFGFFFWIIAARFYSPKDIGEVTTILSIATLVASLSLLGFTNSIIRYFAELKFNNGIINTALSIVTYLSLILGLVYYFSLPYLTPQLSFIQNGMLFRIFLIIFITASAINGTLESAIVANRKSKYIFYKSIIFSLSKLIAPVFLVSYGKIGLFTSFVIATLLSSIYMLHILRSKFNLKVDFKISINIIKKLGKFSIGNYIASLFGILPSTILPLIITTKINPESTAYFYMPYTISTFLNIIPKATAQSLFAEGSYSTLVLRSHIAKAIKLLSILAIPAILLTFLFGKYILLIFGDIYFVEGNKLLQIFSITLVFVSINYFGDTLINITKNLKLYILMNFINAILVFTCTLYLTKYGLIGIGYGWMIAQFITSVIYIILLKFVILNKI